MAPRRPRCDFGKMDTRRMNTQHIKTQEIPFKKTDPNENGHQESDQTQEIPLEKTDPIETDHQESDRTQEIPLKKTDPNENDHQESDHQKGDLPKGDHKETDPNPSSNMRSPCKAFAQPIFGHCTFCGGTFCSKHRMLEAHNCTGLEDCKRESHDRNADKLNNERTMRSQIMI